MLKRDLEHEVVGRRIKEAEVRPGSAAMKVVKRHGRRKELSSALVGAKVERVARYGRLLALFLDNGRVLAIVPGARAQLLKTSASDDIAVHTHVVISFTIGGQLRLVDPDKTSEVYVVSVEEFEAERAAEAPAIDPLEVAVTWQHLSAMLSERSVPLRALLTEGATLIGIGDLYADEVLFAAGLRPDHRTDKLSSSDVRRLYRALMETLQEAVKARGTSYGDDGFRDLSGTPGTFQLGLKVYERDGEACRRCRSTIVKEQVDGATAYLCPRCQS